MLEQNYKPLITLADGTLWEVPSCWMKRLNKWQIERDFKSVSEYAYRTIDRTLTHLITLTYDRRQPSIDWIAELFWGADDEKIEKIYAKQIKKWEKRSRAWEWDKNNKVTKRVWQNNLAMLCQDQRNFRGEVIQAQKRKGKLPGLAVLEDYPSNPHHHLLVNGLHLNWIELQQIWLFGNIDVKEVGAGGVRNRVCYMLKTWGEPYWEDRYERWGKLPFTNTEYDLKMDNTLTSKRTS